MDSKRQSRVAKQIQKDLGDIFQLETRGLFGGAMITVTKVKMTPDLGLAKVYLSLFATDNKEGLLEAIRAHYGEIRYQLGKKLKNQLRKVPELQFYQDDSLDYIENIDNLLNE
ncbi:MAG: 30S ribosome-binding factor RbfA [Bacteroidales bacterium]|nr:30S ribosome-binding factor RbfA [Bacteroidales bacterium]MCF8387370.1 30S ribosome-binding factor RbfA [Bacteroidales bacterium]MCF8397848.1 30S ribosome-binding factor RbfA [Bacteroidales bacterium]